MKWKGEPTTAVAIGTSGLDAAGDRIVEIAAVQFRGEEMTGRFGYGVNPGAGVKLPDDLAVSAGLSPALVAMCPPFASVAPVLLAQLRVHPILTAHNVPFVVGFLTAEYDRAGEAFGKQWRDVLAGVAMIDTLTWAREFQRYEKGGHALRIVSDRMGIGVPEARRASVNAFLVSRVLGAWHGRLPDDLTALLQRQAVLAAEQKKRLEAWQAKKEREST